MHLLKICVLSVGLQAKGLLHSYPGPVRTHCAGLLAHGVGMEVSFYRHAYWAKGERTGTQHNTVTIVKSLCVPVDSYYSALISQIVCILSQTYDKSINLTHLFVTTGEMCALLACRLQHFIRGLQRGVEKGNPLRDV